MRPPIVASLLLVGLLAGCVSGGTVSDLGTTAPAPEGSGGVIQGRVISDELVPIAGAIAALASSDESQPLSLQTETDEGGTFSFSALPIGVTLVVQVLALGYESTGREVTVPGEDAPVDLQFTMQRLASTTPYTEVVITTGFEICTVTIGLFVRSIDPCPIGTPSPADKNTAAESWQYLVVETDWDTQDVFWLYVSHEPGCASDEPCWGNAIGKAPLRVEGAPNDTAMAAKYALDGKNTYPEGAFEFYVSPSYAGMFRDEINNTAGPQCVTIITTFLGPLGQEWNPNLGCGLGYGVSTGIKYTNYVSLFHFAKPDDPAGYSGMPDQ